jgi:hypothetical protein
MKPLPVGIQTLSEIITQDYLYIDKTALAYELIKRYKYVFLSRPRRFGKSLFLDTLKNIFLGNKELFRNLHIYNQWNWDITYPVIKISFSGGIRDNESLRNNLFYILNDNQERLNIICNEKNDPNQCFAELIKKACKQYQQKVVILIDEYDKPILDNIENIPEALVIRDGMRDFYTKIKENDEYLRFVFLTGVSKFSKVSLFSGLNNLEDISLNPDFGNICGYTQHDVDTVFAPYLEGVAMEKVKRWYNGYNFLGDNVYNPFDILLFIKNQKTFKNYWFETGTPTFLMKLFAKEHYFLPNLEHLEVADEILDSFDIEKIQLVTLLFQTGYLTIDKRFETFERLRYQLKIPNQEVRLALSDHFINVYTEQSNELKYAQQNRIYSYLTQVDLPGLQHILQALFAGIPWNNFINNALPEFEGYYASVLYAFFISLNATVIPEDTTNQGQVDLTIIVENKVYIIEIKRDTAKSYEISEKNIALQQIQRKCYAEKYKGQGKKVIQVGMIFNTCQRNLVQMDWVVMESDECH